MLSAFRPVPSLVLIAVCCVAVRWLPAGPTPEIDVSTLLDPLYRPDGTAFVRKDSPRLNNRPLYGHENYSIVLAGDRPLLRLCTGREMNGTLLLAVIRGDVGRWLHEFASVESRYVDGRMEWTLSDPSFPGLRIKLAAATLDKGEGLVARLSAEGPAAGDRLLWAAGGAVAENQSTLWKYDVTTFGRDALLRQSFDPASAEQNRVVIENAHWTNFPGPGPGAPDQRRDGQEWGPADDRKPGHAGVCDLPAVLSVVSADAWADPAKLPGTSSPLRPLLCGVGELPAERPVHWLLRAGATHGPATLDPGSLPALFDASVARNTSVARQIEVNTPDDRLDAAVSAAAVAYRATYRDNVFTHSGMRWGVPLLGWRTLFGATAFGWHAEVLAQAQKCIESQVKEDSVRTHAFASREHLLASQGPDSRLFGKGRITAFHPVHYDMQSQFFDQLVHAWRWTGSEELEHLLRPSLELHLDYIQECFDPDLDGTYESYLNTWPTDGTWFSGGGTAEQTAYAYRGHLAARDMARRAHDHAGASRHEAAAERILTGFKKLLWVHDKGHVGAYREQGGLKRLHESSWLYSTFCPIDSRMLSDLDAPSALYYTEWALERVRMPYGGEQVWPSNWVPSIWSVRQIWPGDGYHLALAYYQSGLSAEAWNVFSGTFPHYFFYGPVPGDTGHPAGGTDFNDISSMFCRTVVEGLFGFAPDRPSGLVRVSPRFPANWPHASIRTPDFTLRFEGSEGRARYELALTDPAPAELVVPVSASTVSQVTINGTPASFTIRPGFGRSEVVVAIPSGTSAGVEVVYRPAPIDEPVNVSVNTGDSVVLTTEDAVVLDWRDPQGALTTPQRDGPHLLGTVAAPEGHRLVQALVQRGELTRWRLFKLAISDPAAVAARARLSFASAPPDARWHTIDLSPVFNGDVRTIYQQEYLSPRPNTVSLRIATDGYSHWQAALDPKARPPTIDLAGVAALTGTDNLLRTSHNAAFSPPAADRNIAFASLWDNWPDTVTVPVNQSGEAVWFLVAGSTNPMQVRIANAELVLRYADGYQQSLELVPPFNYWSLTPQKRVDYNYQRDRFSLPPNPPPQVQLGANCRAMVLNLKLRPGTVLKDVTLRALSEEIIVGLMGVSVQNPSEGAP